MAKKRRRSRRRKGTVPAAFRAQWAKNRRKARGTARKVRRRVRRARRRIIVTAARTFRRRRRRSSSTGAPTMRRRSRRSGSSSVGRRGFFNSGLTAKVLIGGALGATASNQLAPRIAAMLPAGSVQNFAAGTWGQVLLGIGVGVAGALALRKAGQGELAAAFVTGAAAERGAGVLRTYIAQAQASMNGLGFYGIEGQEGVGFYGINGLGDTDYSGSTMPDMSATPYG